MDYEKAYKKALGRAKKLYDQGTITESLSYCFPELKESEDKLTRKDLLEYVKHCVCYRDVCKEEKDRWIAWLEKQGEQKPTWSVEDTFNVQRICKYLDEAKKYYADITEVRECMDWLKSIKERIGG